MRDGRVSVTNTFVQTQSGVNISVRHSRMGRDKVVIIAPGFFQSKQTKSFRNIERDLLSEFDVLSMDFRGHGKSKGWYTFSAKEADDIKSVIEYARQHHKAVGVVGFSYGGAIAIIEQAAHKNMDSLICVCSPMASDKIELQWWKFESLKLFVRGLGPGAGVRLGNPLPKKVNAIDVVSKVSPRPILFIHGSNDPTVSVRHARELYQAAGQPKKIRIFDKGSHAQDLHRTHRAEFIKEIVDWFKETL